MRALYKFKNLENFLDRKGFPKLDTQKVEVIRVDLTTKQEEGKIEFRKDAVYLLHNNLWQKGYMYIKNADVSQYGFPKFHIIECSVIQRQKSRGRFDGHYFWSNEKRVDIKQRESAKIYSNVSLDLCNICRKEYKDILDYETTEGFFNLLDIQEDVESKNVEVDIFGYTRDWRQISKKFRIKNNWTCNNCGIDLTNDKRSLEVHHKNRDKRNNTSGNLECLCISCHSNIDLLHKENLNKSAQRKRRLDAFFKKHVDYYAEMYEIYKNNKI